jgi:hypothetical protein
MRQLGYRRRALPALLPVTLCVEGDTHMKFRSLLPLAALLVAAGCQDVRQPDGTLAQIKDLTGPVLSESTNEVAPAATGRSTVCVAYDNALARAKEAGDEQKVAVLQTIIADACEE